LDVERARVDLGGLPMTERIFVPCDADTLIFHYWWSDDGKPLHKLARAGEILAARDELLQSRGGRPLKGESLVELGVGPIVGTRTYLRGEAVVEEMSLRAILEQVALVVCQANFEQ